MLCDYVFLSCYSWSQCAQTSSSASSLCATRMNVVLSVALFVLLDLSVHVSVDAACLGWTPDLNMSNFRLDK